MLKKIAKRTYAAIPFKRNLFSALRVFYVPPHSVYKHLQFRGPFKTNALGRPFTMLHSGEAMENSIFWAGLEHAWESTSIRLWMRLVKEARVIFDVGANTGVYALIAQAITPTARIFAFEPQETVFSVLAENVRLNNFPITLVDAALSNSERVAKMYFLNDINDYKFTLHHELLAGRAQKLHEKEIKTVPLATIAEKYSVTNIDLMKIDVEGHEDAVLEGMGSLLPDSKPTMLIEILTDELGSAIEKRVAGLGYRYFQIDDDHDTITQVPHLVQHSSHNYLLCSEEKAHELGL